VVRASRADDSPHDQADGALTDADSLASAASARTSDVHGRAASGLHDAFKEHVCNGSWDAKAVGKWLAKHKDRVIGGRCFRVVSRSDSHGAKWQLVRTT
jgi:hypothetical protein